ncbi:MAG: serine hydrolase domain-containing protein [Luteimonas sp.]
MPKLLPAAALAALVFLLSGVTSAATLQSLLQKGVEHGYPGFAMLVRYPDGTIQSAAAGYASLETKRPLRVDDAFNIASITKTFTAVAVLRLVDQRRLSLDAKLANILDPALVSQIPNSDRITVAQLLDHSSGIYATNNDMAYVSTLLGPKADPMHVWLPQELVALAYVNRSKPKGEPGSGHYYSDTNYVLLGLIVQHVVGKSFKQHVEETIFKPLGMNSTYFYSDRLGVGAEADGRVTQGYLRSTDDFRKFIDVNPMFKRAHGEWFNTTLAAERIDAAAGIVSTLPDLMKFADPLFGGKLLSADSQKFLISVGEGMDQAPLNKERVRALQAVRRSWGVLVYKPGDGPGGVNTLMAYRPANGAIYLGFTNSFNFDELDFMMDDVIPDIDPE